MVLKATSEDKSPLMDHFISFLNHTTCTIHPFLNFPQTSSTNYNNFLYSNLLGKKKPWHHSQSPINPHIFMTKNNNQEKKMSSTASLGYGVPTCFNVQQPIRNSFMAKQHNTVGLMKGWRVRHGNINTSKRVGIIRCIGLGDFIGGDLVKFDLGQWLSDVEEHKALAIYSPHEGGYEGRYLSRLKRQGYYFLDLSARGLGDPETTLTKIHPVCPAHVGKQPIARWYYPPEVDYRLEALPPNAKGLVVWIIEAKVLSKAELQFLALLPTLRPNVRVIAECGNWRKFMWKPLKEIAGLTTSEEA